MPTEEKPKTGKLNGRLWGIRARDWAELVEPMTRGIYEGELVYAFLTASSLESSVARIAFPDDVNPRSAVDRSA